MTPMHFRSAAGLAVALALTAAQTARAEVHDNANLFSPAAVSAANDATQQMMQRHGRGLVIETFPSVPAADRAAVEQDKAGYFKRMTTERGRATGVDGVYVLICMDPRFVDLRPGKLTEQHGDFTTADVQRVSAQLKKDLGANNDDQALSDTVAGVEQAYTTNITGGRPAAGAMARQPSAGTGMAAPMPSTPQSNAPMSAPSGGFGMGKGIGLGGLICVGLGLFIIFSLVRKMFNRGGGPGVGGGFGGGGGGPNYPTGGPTYGGGANYGPGQQAGMGGMMGGGGQRSGFGSGLLGGLLGGAVGGVAADRFEHRNDPAGGGAVGGGGGDVGAGGFGGGGGSPGFDAGPSDAGQLSDNSGGGGDFGGGGGGGGADSGGGGGGDAGAGGF